MALISVLFALKIVEDIHIRPLRAGSLLKSSYIPYIYISPSLTNIRYSENVYWINGEGVGCRTIMVGVLVELALQDMPSVSLLWAFHRPRPLYYTLLLSPPHSWALAEGSIPTQNFMNVIFNLLTLNAHGVELILTLYYSSFLFIPLLLLFLSLSLFPPHPFLFWNCSSHTDSLSFTFFHRDEHQRDRKEIK